jgi:serine/threonine-protein kinase
LQYKGSTKTITEIAKELKVASVLAGTVRKAGEQVRISVSLNDGNTNKLLWNNDYDRHLKDIFAIQSEIAQVVARKLQAEIIQEVE